MAQNVQAMINSMSLEKKVGQLFIFGFTGKKYSTSLDKTINRLYPGSIIVFGRNISSLNQIKKINSKASYDSLENTQVPLFIAVDQEGGKVLRIKTQPSLPSAKTLGMTKDPELVRSAGFVTGQLLNVLGFNMNLAPVVDIAGSHQKDFLENRTFGNTKAVVSQMSLAFARGLNDAGVLPTAKHFPGHGGTEIDSHEKTPFKKIGISELMSEDLAPYRDILQQKVPFAVMASHVAFPLIDKSRVPASFSPVLLQSVLREKIGFPGIIMTDDIQMKGSQINNLSIGEKVVKAINAGVDMIMVGWNFKIQKQAVDGLIQAVRTEKISEDRINQSLERILNAKFRFFQPHEEKDNLRDQLQQIAFSKIYSSVFEKVIANQQPTTLPTDALRVMSYSRSFLNSFKKQSRSSKTKFTHLSQVSRLKKSSHETIVFHISGPTSYSILKKAPAETKQNIIVVNSSSKITVENEDDFHKVINVFSYHPELGSMAAGKIVQSEQSSHPKRKGELN